MKRALAMLLALCLLLGQLPAAVSAEDTIPVETQTPSAHAAEAETLPAETEPIPTKETEPATEAAEETVPLLGSASGTCGENLTWTLDDGGTLTISGEGAMEDYSYDGAPWYNERNSIISISVAEGVTSIGEYAFYSSANLTSALLPSTVTSIGDDAFGYCGSLGSIDLPAGLTVIGFSAFNGCRSLISIVIPDGVTDIDSYTFRDCSSLMSVHLPDGLTEIGEWAFDGCSSLSSIELPACLNTIYGSAFCNCSSLAAIDFPDGLRFIGTYAFRNCNSLTTVTIPAEVYTIGYAAFACCENLTGIYVSEDNPWYSSDELGVLFSKDKTILMQVPNSFTGAYSVPESVTSLGDGAFYGCSGLTSVNVHDRVTCFGKNAFSDCTGLASIDIPDGVTNLGSYVFSGCNFEFIDLPNALTSIGSYAFYECKELREVVIPENVTYLGSSAFSQCTGIKSIIIPESITELESYTFENCVSLSSIILPTGLASIGYDAFWGCSRLKKIIFQGDSPSIDDNAFQWVQADAIIPAGNDTWTDDVKQNYGGTLNWVIRGEVACFDITAMPSVTSYLVNEPLDLTGFEGTVTYDNGTYETLLPEMMEVSADLSTPGRKTVTLSYGGRSVSYEIAVHNGSRQLLDPKQYPESEHNYANYTDETKTVTVPGFDTIVLVFSEETRTESGWDYIYIYDGNGNQVGRYSGYELAGMKVVVPGDTAQIRLTSDGSGHYYGYSFSSIYGETIEHDETPVEAVEATCTTDGRTGGTICDICGEGTSQVILAFGHDYEKEFISATEESGAVLRYTCTRCGDVYEEPYDYIGEGLCGEELSWTLEEQTLFFTGQGTMDDYSNPTVDIAGAAPWYGYYGNFSTISWLPVRYREIENVGAYAFYDADNLTRGELPFDMLTVGEGAFAECSNLTEMKFPGTVVSIGDQAFRNCTVLNILGDISSVASIGDSAFENCSSLTRVSVFDALVSIGDRAFANTGLTEIYLPRTVRHIGQDAFAGIENLTIYGSAGSYAETYAAEHGYSFYDRGVIESGTYGDNITWTLYGDHSLVISGTGEIPEASYSGDYPWSNQAANARSLIIESGITVIPESAFDDWDFRRIKHISVPATLTSIGEFAFDSSMETKSVNLEDLSAWLNVEMGGYCSNPTAYSDAVLFINGEEITDLVIPEGTSTIPERAFYGFRFLRSVTIPDSVTQIGDYAFSSCDNLYELRVNSLEHWATVEKGYVGFSEITDFYVDGALVTDLVIPATVTEIGACTFQNFTGLTGVTFPDALERVGNSAFYGCENIQAVRCSGLEKWLGIEFGNSWANPLYFGDGLYLDGELVTEVVIPDTVTAVSESAFANYNALTSVQIPEGVTDIAYAAFAGCSNLAEITIPDTLTTIGQDAFRLCDQITELELPASLTEVGKDAFYFTTALARVEIPSIRDWLEIRFGSGYANPICYDGSLGMHPVRAILYVNGKAVTEVTVPGEITDIGDYAFYMYDTLTGITFHDRVTSIGEYAFRGCDELTDVKLSNRLSELGSYAFAWCDNLTGVRIPASLTVIPSGAFYGCSNLERAYLPDGLTEVQWNAFCDSGLTEITIPASVTKLESSCFEDCSDLAKIRFEGNAPEQNGYSFRWVTAEAYYPDGNTTWTEAAMANCGGDLTWIPYTVYGVMEEGTGNVVEEGEELAIHIEADHTTLVAVYMDGQLVAPEHYTVTEGSTIITFKAEYLATLDGGDHKVTAEFSDGVANATITVRSHIPGDVTGDGKVNNRDAARLMQYLAGWDVEYEEAALDVNGDGKVNNRDAARLMQYLAGWDVEIH